MESVDMSGRCAHLGKTPASRGEFAGLGKKDYYSQRPIYQSILSDLGGEVQVPGRDPTMAEGEHAISTTQSHGRISDPGSRGARQQC